MQFTSFALTAALCIGSALAAQKRQDAPITVHVVKVGGASNGTAVLKYSPSKITAAVGDMVQFQFAPKNHTVTQSTFDNPCAPVSLHSNITGIHSGFIPVTADAEMTATFTMMVTDQKPIWLYCAQAKHCQSGMVMVINENTAANASRSLENFAALASTQTQNLAPSGASTPSNGTSGTSTPNSGSGSTSGSDSGSGTATSSGAPTSQTVAAAPTVRVSGSLAIGGVLAVVMALFV